jgi:hypothetical protein
VALAADAPVDGNEAASAVLARRATTASLARRTRGLRELDCDMIGFS